MRKLLGFYSLLFWSCLSGHRHSRSPRPHQRHKLRLLPQQPDRVWRPITAYRNNDCVCAHRPVKSNVSAVPQGATAQCRDGCIRSASTIVAHAPITEGARNGCY